VLKPPNKLQVSFGRWIGVAVPLCVLLTTLCWAYLLAVFQPTDVTNIPPIVRSKESLNRSGSIITQLKIEEPHFGRPGRKMLLHIQGPQVLRSFSESWGDGRRDWVVLCLSMVTILLWSTLEFTRPYLGDLGIVSLLFIVTMFGSGMLTQVGAKIGWGGVENGRSRPSSAGGVAFDKDRFLVVSDKQGLPRG
jgi:di/tricarboxylate transporter